MKHIHVVLEDEEYDTLSDIKEHSGRTWRDMLLLSAAKGEVFR